MTKAWANLVGIAVVGAAFGCIGSDAAPDGIDSQQGEIRNGTPVPFPRSDSQVLIVNGTLAQGTGTLLSQEWVLTAGHVVDNRRTRTSAITVRLGNLSDPLAQVRSAVAVYHHPGHAVDGLSGGSPSEVDVALVRVSPPFTGALTRSISTLATSALLNTSPICAGYGQTIEGNIASSGTLMIGSVRVTSTSTNFVQVVPGIFNDIFLPGDSGGPCFDIGGSVVGVMSSLLGTPATSGFLAPAAAFRTWALGTMASCAGLTPGADNFCSPTCPCVYGGFDCDGSNQCSTGNVCEPDVGAAFGTHFQTDVCVSSSCGADTIGSDSYCKSCPCGYGGGDCDGSAQCQDGLVCAADYGPMFKMSPVTDVCVTPACTGRTPGSDPFCSPTCPCGHGGGDCDNNSQCMPGLVCATDLGPAFGMKPVTDVCVPAACVGTMYTADFCSDACPCGHGGGDCDDDGDCLPDHECVHDVGEQFGASATTDICMSTR